MIEISFSPKCNTSYSLLKILQCSTSTRVSDEQKTSKDCVIRRIWMCKQQNILPNSETKMYSILVVIRKQIICHFKCFRNLFKAKANTNSNFNKSDICIGKCIHSIADLRFCIKPEMEK